MNNVVIRRNQLVHLTIHIIIVLKNIFTKSRKDVYMVGYMYM